VSYEEQMGYRWRRRDNRSIGETVRDDLKQFGIKLAVGAVTIPIAFGLYVLLTQLAARQVGDHILKMSSKPLAQPAKPAK
jgi:hypothetical protein